MIKEETIVNLMRRWYGFKVRCTSDFARTETAKKNNELKNKYENERCFVLGNAKSLKEHDLSVLKNETVFVTNGFVNYEHWYDVRPDYYVMIDPILFQETGWRIIKKIDEIRSYEHKPIFIVPYRDKKVVHEQYKWDEWAQMYYIQSEAPFMASYSGNWDIVKPVPFPMNVTMTSILLATYMGFKNIYLLGVEETGIIEAVGAYFGKVPVRYVYENEPEIIDHIKSTPIEKVLSGYATIFQQYREVYNYCQQRGVEVFNCTEETLVSSIPYASFEAIKDLHKKN